MISLFDEVISEADRRQRIAADPNHSAWVAASAGTGKTKVLSDRVLNLLLEGTPPERLWGGGRHGGSVLALAAAVFDHSLGEAHIRLLQ